MRRKFGTLVAALTVTAGLLLAYPGIVSASVFQDAPPCGYYMIANTACFLENSNGTGDEILVFQGLGTAKANLDHYSVTYGDRLCDGAPLLQSDWNDCIDWVWVRLNAGSRLCLYTNANYTGLEWWVPGPINTTYVLSGSFHDSISSIRITTTC